MGIKKKEEGYSRSKARRGDKEGCRVLNQRRKRKARKSSFRFDGRE